MVKIPYIKIPGVRVGSIGPASNIGTGGATPAPPAPITYLTQWKIVGNSEVHTDPYLTSWKVSGNSVVDNNAILSCGDLGQDGNYHVKISNGVTIFDIPLTEPLRKVNDVADSIEFANGVATLTRKLCRKKETLTAKSMDSRTRVAYCKLLLDAYNPGVGVSTVIQNLLADKIPLTLSVEEARTYNGIAIVLYSSVIYVRNSNIEQTVAAYTNFLTALGDVEYIYELATPTTELVDVSSFPVSPTDTYTSANETPYSAFEHTENKEIWSCGEYNATDGKYHILVQPQGGSIADIALDEPLRKVNGVADTIEFPSGTEGKALVTRLFGSTDMGKMRWRNVQIGTTGYYKIVSYALINVIKKQPSYYSTSNVLTAIYAAISAGDIANRTTGVGINANGDILIYDPDYNQSDSATAFKAHVDGVEFVYELATPTTELVDAPQIEEADSYTMVISQGGKAVSWSSFETNRE